MEREPKITHLLVVFPSTLSSLSFESIHVSMYSTLTKTITIMYMYIYILLRIPANLSLIRKWDFRQNDMMILVVQNA